MRCIYYVGGIYLLVLTIGHTVVSNLGMSAHAATVHLHNVTSCHIGRPAKPFHGPSPHYLSA